MGVAGYYRVSLARDEMRAPELYQGEIERYCSYRDLSLDHVFSDIDYSGYKRSEQRPALKELVRRRHEFSAVVIPKLSRFGRSMKHLAQLFETFDSEGIPLIFLDLGMDTSTSQGRLLRHIMAAFAEYESDVKADYTRANYRMAALEGRVPGGEAPTGYRRENKTYVIDQDEAVAIREIFRQYDDGISQRRIARALNEAGLHQRQGGKWGGAKVGKILDNPSYAALRLLDDELRPGQWEPIVDPKLWKRLAKKRSAAPFQIPRQRGYKKPHHLLAGLIVCGRCGRPAFHRSRGPNRTSGYYSCKNANRDWVPETDRCRNGGVVTTIAERFVTEAFLERATFRLMTGPLGIFSPTAQWESLGNDERRMLLAAAIEKVIIVPRPEGDPRARRELAIEWRSIPAPVAPVPTTVYPDSAHERFRQREARRPERERQERSERAKRYSREWNEHRERFNNRERT
jgi:DNA invertase Pin-like site-specific DNA recombinase/ribosomal protein L37E